MTRRREVGRSCAYPQQLARSLSFPRAQDPVIPCASRHVLCVACLPPMSYMSWQWAQDARTRCCRGAVRFSSVHSTNIACENTRARCARQPRKANPHIQTATPALARHPSAVESRDPSSQTNTVPRQHVDHTTAAPSTPFIVHSAADTRAYRLRHRSTAAETA